MAKGKLLGAWGEALAAEHLRRRRCEVVGCNYTTRLGEIDVIAKDGKCIAFVEVKLRKDESHGEAREFVTPEKQRKLRQTAALYLAEYPTELQPRFDVIEIYAPDGMATKKPKITHWKDAFT